MATATDVAAILRAVLDEPEEDVHRLAYADAMEEAGQDARVTLIRVQVEMATRAASEECRQCAAARQGKQRTNGPCQCSPWWQDRRHALGDAMSLDADVRAFLGPVRAAVWPKSTPTVSRRGNGEVDLIGGFTTDSWRIRFVRGFVEEVHLPAASWIRHADMLTACHPIRQVTLTTPMAITYSRPPAVPRGKWLASPVIDPEGRRPRWMTNDGVFIISSNRYRDTAYSLTRTYWPRIAFRFEE